MVKAQEMQNRGVEVMHVHSVDGGREAELVCGTVHIAATSPAAGEPHRETVVVVVAARQGR